VFQLNLQTRGQGAPSFNHTDSKQVHMQLQALNCHCDATLQEYHSSTSIKHWTLWCPPC